MENPPRRGNPGKMYSLDTIHHALRLCKLRRIYRESTGRIPRKYTYQAIANKVGVWSKNTISKWDRLDMSEKAIKGRLNRYALL